jgi:hypothetical protein
MKNLTSHKVRSMLMLSGVAAMMGTTMMVSQPARADKAQNYKIGAAALGVLGVVLAAKGKTAPALLAGAGAYYAYEKGKDAENDERYDYRYGNRYNDYYQNDNYYGNYGSYNNYDNRYGDRDYNGDYGNRYGDHNRYNNDSYRYDRYNNRYDGRSYSGR